MSRQGLALGLSIVATLGFAAAQAQDAPKPGPEHKAMAYFTGTWRTEGETKPGAFGPGGKMTSTDTCEWFAGGFQVVCKGTGKSPMGAMTTLGVLAYNAMDKAYTYYGIDNAGTSEISQGTHSGKTWTFTSTSTMGGKPIKSRFTMVEMSPTSYTFKWETSPDGGAWTEVLSGKSTKTGK